MRHHLKKAWAALKTKRAILVALALLVIVFGSMALFGGVTSETEAVALVTAVREDGGDTYVLGKDERFENKILEFLKVDKLCAVTAEQAEQIKSGYSSEVKEFYIVQEARTAFVLYVTKANFNQLEKTVGAIDDGDCRVVHSGKVLALLTPSP